MINILSQLKNYLESDNHTDKLIAIYIFDNYKNSELININKIASNCKTSPTRVTRFAEKLGYSGFSELKYRLIDMTKTILIDGTEVGIIEEIKNNDDSFFKKYYEIKLKSIEDQYKYFLEKDMSFILDSFYNAKIIYMFGFNLSYNISKNFAQRLRWLGYNIIIESDIISIKTYLNNIKKNDLVFVVSISGNNEFIRELVDVLYGRTTILGIVGESCSFIDKLNDFLPIITDENKLWTVNSIKAQLTIQYLDYIYAKFIQEKI